jgi:hypothetical protein
MRVFAEVAVGLLREERSRQRKFDERLRGLTGEDAEDVEERAAIIQFDAGKRRADAERLALELFDRKEPRPENKG